MENYNVNDVYGTALYEASSELWKTSEFRGALSDIDNVFKEFPEFFQLLKTPAMPASQRKESAQNVMGGKIPDEILNFIYILIDKRRIGQFKGIVKIFEKKVDQAEGITKGRIVSASPLTEKQIKSFEEQTSKLMKLNVTLMPETDKTIIGGVRVYVEGKLIDASIRKKLDDLKEQLLS